MSNEQIGMAVSKAGIKWIISLIAILLWVAHLVFPKINIDLITVSLLAVAVIPWAEGLFKSVELPGGLKIEFQDLERIGLEVDNPARFKGVSLVRIIQHIIFVRALCKMRLIIRWRF